MQTLAYACEKAQSVRMRVCASEYWSTLTLKADLFYLLHIRKTITQICITCISGDIFMVEKERK